MLAPGSVVMVAVVILAAASPAAAAEAGGLRVRIFTAEKPLYRAQQPATLVALVENAGPADAEVAPNLLVPEGVRVGKAAADAARLPKGGQVRWTWEVEADRAVHADFALEVRSGDRVSARAALAMEFLPSIETIRSTYIPEPQPAKTSLLVGAHHCPLWEAERPEMWNNVLKHPERTPALGFYDQKSTEVSDWETKWAVEHGISFFIYCWYRTSQGGPVTTQFSSAIHDGLLKSKFKSRMKFAIMWENQRRGKAGVADEKDLMENLLPYWIEHYFRDPSYLKIDNRPLLFVYRPEFLVQDLGGADKVAAALGTMRQACKNQGFDGLTILGEYRGLDPRHLNLMKQLGLDYTFAYVWPVGGSPTPEQAIRLQMDRIRKTQALGILPQVVTVSQAWSGWNDEGSIWKIPPREYQTLLEKAKDFVAALPKDQLGGRMLLLDNWNEWGEGHYIAPYREYGFGYLDAVRRVFSDAVGPHVDLIPDDIGLGPYDSAFKARRP